MSDYVPISCHFYDELEALAVKKELCKVVYFEGKKQIYLEDYIVDFRTKAKEEFVILKSGLEIRLDYLTSVNGKKLEEYC
jgi:Rho-binding antiterminator